MRFSSALALLLCLFPRCLMPDRSFVPLECLFGCAARSSSSSSGPVLLLFLLSSLPPEEAAVGLVTDVRGITLLRNSLLSTPTVGVTGLVIDLFPSSLVSTPAGEETVGLTEGVFAADFFFRSFFSVTVGVGVVGMDILSTTVFIGVVETDLFSSSVLVVEWEAAAVLSLLGSTEVGVVGMDNLSSVFSACGEEEEAVAVKGFTAGGAVGVVGMDNLSSVFSICREGETAAGKGLFRPTACRVVGVVEVDNFDSACGREEEVVATKDFFGFTVGEVVGMDNLRSLCGVEEEDVATKGLFAEAVGMDNLSSIFSWEEVVAAKGFFGSEAVGVMGTDNFGFSPFAREETTVIKDFVSPVDEVGERAIFLPAVFGAGLEEDGVAFPFAP